MRHRRRWVTTSGRERTRSRLWGYSYADLAVLFGMQEAAVRQAVQSKRFDPADLASVVDFANRRGVRGALLKPSEP